MAMLMLTGAVSAAPAPAQEQATALDIHEKIALAKVQGKVLERRAQKYPTGFNYEYLIEARDGRKLFVEVDGKTRKVFAVMDTAPVAIDEILEEEDDSLSLE